MCEPPLGCFIVLEIQATKEHFFNVKETASAERLGFKSTD